MNNSIIPMECEQKFDEDELNSILPRFTYL